MKLRRPSSGSSEDDGTQQCSSASSPDGTATTMTTAASSLICGICGDVATGRHYNATACNGCKGFFRRTIRRSYKYTCRFVGACNIDKHNRAICRACRYSRCIRSGMQVSAVQRERDVIGRRKKDGENGAEKITSVSTTSPATPAVTASSSSVSSSSASSSSSTPDDATWEAAERLLDALLQSERQSWALRDTVMRQSCEMDYGCDGTDADNADGRCATVNDVLLSLHSQLRLAIEWAKMLPPFAQLPLDDQTALLRQFAAQHVVLGVAYRSVDASPDALRLLNDARVTRQPNDAALWRHSRTFQKVMDELVAPMRFLRLDAAEFVALKAAVLFNPVATGVSPSSVPVILAQRRRVWWALAAYERRTRPDDPTRLGDLSFFLLAPLQSLAASLCGGVAASARAGEARLDVLMEELMLAEEQQPIANRNGASDHQHVVDQGAIITADGSGVDPAFDHAYLYTDARCLAFHRSCKTI